MKKIFTLLALTFTLMACTHHTYTVSETTNNSTPRIREKMPEMVGPQISSAVPDATAFRMSGDYAHNVAVTLNANGEFLYFPAPSDITADSEPVELVDGWWLNNQGLGPNSVFTKYTFAEYASLPATPSIEQLKLSIIPGAKVTGFMELPYKIGEANDNLEAVKDFVKTH